MGAHLCLQLSHCLLHHATVEQLLALASWPWHPHKVVWRLAVDVRLTGMRGVNVPKKPAVEF